MTNISRYLVNVSLLCYTLCWTLFLKRHFKMHFFPSPSHPLLSLSLLTAPADILTPGWGCAECGGSPVTSLLPGSEQKAVESTDVPGCRNRSHSPPRCTEPGENRCLMVNGACKLWLDEEDIHIPMHNDLLVSSTHAGWAGELLFQIHLSLRCN